MVGVRWGLGYEGDMKDIRIGLALLGIVCLSSCSLLIDFDECSTSEDCEAKFGAGVSCEAGICQTSTPAGLLGGPCQRVIGPVDAGNAFNIGVLLPTSGDEAGFGIPLVNAIEVAQSDINSGGGVLGRPIGLVVCDTEGLDDVALQGAEHLVNRAKVAAIIGPDFSRQTIDVANEHTIPGNTVLVTPSGTAASITTLADNNLVWRTCPSDNLQGQALAQVVANEIDSLDAVERPVVWSFHLEQDTYGVGLQETLNSGLGSELVASESYIARVYPTNWQEWIVGQLSSLPEPDLIVLLGASEAWDIAEEIDRIYPGKKYFFADAAKNNEEAMRTSSDLEGRILGVAPQNVGEAGYTPFLNFSTKYRSRFDGQDPAQLQFVANAYDALIAVAFGAASGGFTGTGIAEGMSRISDPNGQSIEGSQTAIQLGFQTLSQEGTIDYQGASGPLDFDANGDPANTPIALWCFRDSGTPEVGVVLSSEGKFTPLDCDAAPTNNPDPDPDMGADMGMPDMQVDMEVDMGDPDADM